MLSPRGRNRYAKNLMFRVILRTIESLSTSGKDLAANGAFVFLGPVYVRMMPPIGHRLVARHAAVQRWESSGELDE